MRKTTMDGKLPLNDEQEKALRHDYKNPLWVIAGPGTGKTHTLVWLVLKRVIVDQISPEKIFLTTFTKKAAAELESRLIQCKNQLISAGLESAKQIDINKFKLGTLHSLCSKILNEERYEPTLRVRVLEDEIAQRFFISRFTKGILKENDIQFWRDLGYAGKYISNPEKIKYAIKLFNRMTENQVDIDKMLNSPKTHIQSLANYYLAYQEDLKTKGRIDQAHLQLHFLQFLKSPEGMKYMDRGFTVLVDEYQDTNPIQEEIYFHLSGDNGDFTVVGDDDQSLYRFRGATVESLVRFDEACKQYLKTLPVRINLNENRRSHTKIIEWVNRFIENHPDMKDENIPVRAPQKPTIKPGPQYSGKYPAVMAIDERDHKKAGEKMSQLIKELYNEKLIIDYSQVALLSFSTKETTHGIKQYIDALKNKNIPYYNPRNKSTHKTDIFLAMIGALITIVDPYTNSKQQRQVFGILRRNTQEYVLKAKGKYNDLIKDRKYHELKEYVEASIKAIENTDVRNKNESFFLVRQGGRRVTLSMLLYKLLAHEPFYTSVTEDEENSGRLKTLNIILSEYESLFDNGEIKVKWDDETQFVKTDHWSLYNFYSVFIDGIHDGLNDPEDEEVSIQPGRVNVMTIHQSKGLEFEVIFVIRPDKMPFVSDTHKLEDLFEPYIHRVIKPNYRSQELRASEDAIRMYFVAYSRAKNLLVLTGSDCSKWSPVLGFDKNGRPINSKEALQIEGVHVI